jgi:hypothetical protein
MPFSILVSVSCQIPPLVINLSTCNYRCLYREFLGASLRLSHNLHMLTCLHPISFGGLVKNPDGSLEVRTPCYKPDTLQAFTWVARDLGPCALALFKNYRDHKEILGQTFHAVNTQATHADFAKMIQKGLSSYFYFDHSTNIYTRFNRSWQAYFVQISTDRWCE